MLSDYIFTQISKPTKVKYKNLFFNIVSRMTTRRFIIDGSEKSMPQYVHNCNFYVGPTKMRQNNSVN